MKDCKYVLKETEEFDSSQEVSQPEKAKKKRTNVDRNHPSITSNGLCVKEEYVIKDNAKKNSSKQPVPNQRPQGVKRKTTDDNQAQRRGKNECASKSKRSSTTSKKQTQNAAKKKRNTKQKKV